MLGHVQLFVNPWTVALQASLYMEFSRQKYWSELLFSTPGVLPDPGIELSSLASPALAGRFFTTMSPEKHIYIIYVYIYIISFYFINNAYLQVNDNIFVS